MKKFADHRASAIDSMCESVYNKITKKDGEE
jgi:hypothetical protein